MNKIARYTRLFLIVVFCMTMSLLFVACGDTQKTYTVTFDAGPGITVASQEVSEGKTATKPVDPEKFGYSLFTWKNGNESWDFSSPITQDITLVADWRQYLYFDDDKITRVDNFYAPADLTIPAEFKTIGERAFINCHSIRSIKLSPGITTIEDEAFSNCFNLESVKIPDSVTTIGQRAFYECIKLTDVTIPDGITTIGAYTFASCRGIENISLPDSVTSIGDGAFAYCSSLEEFVVPKNVVSIGRDAFNQCNAMTKFSVAQNCKLETIGAESFYFCQNLEEISIPATVDKIGYNAFDRCSDLKKVCITDIAAWCSIEFENERSNPLNESADLYVNNTKTTQIAIPDGATKVCDYAFYGYDNLESVTFAGSVQSIGKYAFAYCDNLAVSVFDNDSQLSVIDDYAFFHSGVSDITIPASVTEIKYNAFNSTNLQTLVFDADSKLEKIGSYAFYGIKVKSVTIPSGTKIIDEGAFGLCSNLEQVVFAGTQLKTIGKYAFSACTKLASITFPDGIESVGMFAFAGCTSLKNIDLPDSISIIDKYVFEGCSALESIFVPDSIVLIDQEAFEDCTGLTSVTFGENPKTEIIGYGVFRNCTALRDFYVPASLKKIGNYAFQGCDNMQNVYITDLSAWCQTEMNTAFGNPLGSTAGLYLNGSLVTEVDVADDVKTIGNAVFYKYAKLQKVTFGENSSLVSIGESAFGHCTGLTEIVIPESVENISSSAFSYCENLESIDFGDNKLITQINSFTFFYCEKLKNVVIPQNVTVIGMDAFGYCESLDNIVISDKVTHIYNSAFQNTGIVNVYVPSSVANLGRDAFSRLRKVTIYCEAQSQPQNWATSWNDNNDPVYWGVDQVYADDQGLDYIIKDGKAVITDYNGSGKVVQIPSQLDGYAVSGIGYRVFDDCDTITKVTISAFVENIESMAFCHYGKQKVYCEAQSKPDGWADDWVADYVPVYFGATLSTDSQGVDYITKDGNVVITGYSGEGTDVTIPSSYNGNTVTAIEQSAFECQGHLKSILLPDTITSIGDFAFASTDLRKIVIPASVIQMGHRVFFNSNSAVVICGAQSKPDGWADDWMDSSTDNPVYWGNPQIVVGQNGVQYVVTQNGAMVVAYLGDDVNVEIASTVGGQPVVAIEKKAFTYNNDILSVYIPASVKTIGERAFDRCKNLRTVTIEDNSQLTKMENGAFLDCEQLTDITFGNNSKLESLGLWVFQNCKKLTHVVLPDELKVISSYVFSGCENLESINIPSKVTTLGSAVLTSCPKLQSLTMPQSVAYVSRYAFAHCENLTIYCEASVKPDGWDDNWNDQKCVVYWYSQNQPATNGDGTGFDGNWWHYVDGEITKWVYQAQE